MLIGCQASVDTASRPRDSYTEETTTYQPPSRARTEAEHIRDDALAIQNSRDRIEEAAAIRRLNDYLADRNLTFNVAGQRALDDAQVQSLSASPDRLRVRVDVFRGQQPVQSFTFIPRDNRNLTLLGA
jgi:hypothetical protein